MAPGVFADHDNHDILAAFDVIKPAIEKASFTEAGQRFRIRGWRCAK
jgi:hypothetical protein